MQGNFWFTLLGITLVGTSFGQVKKQFTVEDSDDCENVRLCLKANSGNCFIKPGQNSDILDVFSNQDEGDYSHNFRKEINGKTCEVVLRLDENHTEGVSRSISTRFFWCREAIDRTSLENVSYR